MRTKKEFKYFTIFNHGKEEEYLRMMHKHGWRFVRVGGLGVYHFEECEPCDVVYQLDYNPQSKERKDEYLQMFRDCGWEYVQDFVGYSYFRKPAEMMNGEETIFNDDESRAAMMGRVYKGRALPLAGIFCGCLMPQFVMRLCNGDYIVAAVLGAILSIYIAFFIGCAVSHYRMKKK